MFRNMETSPGDHTNDPSRASHPVSIHLCEHSNDKMRYRIVSRCSSCTSPITDMTVMIPMNGPLYGILQAEMFHNIHLHCKLPSLKY